MTVKELKIDTADIGTIEVTVNEYNLAEIKKLITEWQEGIDFCESVNQNPEMYIFVEYKDGSTYTRSFGEESGTFKKTGIKAVEMDDGYEYYTFGKYEFNECGVLTVA